MTAAVPKQFPNQKGQEGPLYPEADLETAEVLLIARIIMRKAVKLILGG